MDVFMPFVAGEPVDISITGFSNGFRIRDVGATGFEPATLCSQSRCATGLRYAPIRCSTELAQKTGAYRYMLH